MAVGHGWSQGELDEYRRWTAQLGWTAPAQDSWLQAGAAHGWTMDQLVAEIQRGMAAAAAPAQASDGRDGTGPVASAPGTAGSAPGSAPGAAPGATPKKKSSTKKKVVWGVAGVAVVAVASLFVAVLAPLVPEIGRSFGFGLITLESTQPSATGGFAAVHVGVDPEQKFVYKIDFPVDDDTAAEDIVEVYLDAALTVPAPDADVFVYPGKVTVEPTFRTIGKHNDAGTEAEEGFEFTINRNNEWGMFDRYYVAVKKDAKGTALAKPVVSVFTSEAGSGSPVANYEPQPGGGGVFRWTALDGATKYALVKVTTTGLQWSGVDFLATTDKSEISASDIPEEWEDDPNVAFVTYEGNSQDEARDPARAAFGPFLEQPALFGVVALDADGAASSVALINQQDISAGFPRKVAEFALAEVMAGRGSDVGALPDQVPVTMADGSTTTASVEYAVDEVDKLGRTYETTYTVLGSKVKQRVEFTAESLDSAKASLAATNARSLSLQANTGGRSAYTYITADTLAGEKASSAAPEVPYPVFGTTDLSTFIAANFVAGNFKISLADYFEPDSRISNAGLDIDDVLGEVTAQNPYLLGPWGVSYNQEIRVLVGQPEGFTDKATYHADQAALHDRAKEAAASIGPGLSQKDQVRAINDWLVAHTTYDYDAYRHWLVSNGQADGFERAFGPQGVLVDGTGVCASYASAFKTVAFEAGIKAVVVRGVARYNGLGHAWSRAEVDGVWLNLDVTWNETSGGSTWLSLTDAQMDADHKAGTNWVVDSQLANYTSG
ncbi:transglutaminase domain-containing protein [Cellulomonas sp. URHD0024]|uniref:transglutaminase domain-containing protein n=1 Tax=Cellulomonas sp. URHD0024 TaxID=1302620 RepID=UPI0004216D49|nr:transglutaminase domain-containing protein [Cellulomonas sp. URHD0024]